MTHDQSILAQSPFPLIAPAQAEIESIHRAPALTFNPKEYAHYVRDYDLSEEQQRELLEAIWSIMVGFVDLGFGIHPIQQARDSTKMLETDSPSVLAFEQISENTGMIAASLASDAGQEDS